ncbi:unnamed protein product [Periconia digitata]|uniref:Uncharacterized protein n=1 Tax=Periconia digitata TaxID=1303443 RepID=A0A9W4XX90_9PLEO|nr:unnamed protein product [Periconia digitata]
MLLPVLGKDVMDRVLSLPCALSSPTPTKGSCVYLTRTLSPFSRGLVPWFNTTICEMLDDATFLPHNCSSVIQLCSLFLSVAKRRVSMADWLGRFYTIIRVACICCLIVIAIAEGRRNSSVLFACWP